MGPNYKFSTPIENHKENYGLWVPLMCQARLISCNKCTILVEDVDLGRGSACVGARGR